MWCRHINHLIQSQVQIGDLVDEEHNTLNADPLTVPFDEANMTYLSMWKEAQSKWIEVHIFPSSNHRETSVTFATHGLLEVIVSDNRTACEMIKIGIQ